MMKKYAKWNYADLPIIPAEFQYKIYGGKQKQFKVVKFLMNRKRRNRSNQRLRRGTRGRADLPSGVCTGKLQKAGQTALDFINGRIRNPARALKTSKTAARMTTFINQPCAAYGRIGWWVSTLQGFFSLLYRKTLNIGRVQTPTAGAALRQAQQNILFQKGKNTLPFPLT